MRRGEEERQRRQTVRRSEANNTYVTDLMKLPDAQAAPSLGHGGRGEGVGGVRVFWRQRIAVANAKGVASAIRHRVTPICSGAHCHWPSSPITSQTSIFAPLPAQLAPTRKTRRVARQL